MTTKMQPLPSLSEKDLRWRAERAKHDLEHMCTQENGAWQIHELCVRIGVITDRLFLLELLEENQEHAYFKVACQTNNLGNKSDEEKRHFFLKHLMFATEQAETIFHRWLNNQKEWWKSS